MTESCDKSDMCSRRVMRFRPCIDLHAGKVKQIVGSTLSESSESEGQLQTNFETEKGAAEFADMYKADNLPGGHVIMLGPNCEEAAIAALHAYPNGLQVGGGVTPANAQKYLDAGASHVIVTSYVFRGGGIAWDRLEEMVRATGKDRLVLDLSCRKRPASAAQGDEQYYVVTDKWQQYTNFPVTKQNVETLSQYCAEFLVHGVEVEGKRCGILEDLVKCLGDWSPVPVTYAGGTSTLADMESVRKLGNGKVDLTIGSALDIFGGELPYRDVIDWQRRQEAAT